MARSIKWDTSDIRDIRARVGPYELRVRAEARGTVWVAYIQSDTLDYRSEHTSKDAAKQRIAKYLRMELGTQKPKDPSVPKL